MGRINRGQVLDEVIKQTAFDTARDELPKELASKIVPVLVVNERARTQFNRHATDVNSNFSLPNGAANRKQYVTGFTVSFGKDATSPANSLEVRATINGSTTVLGSIKTPTSTAVTGRVMTHTFNPPLRVDNGTGFSGVFDTTGAGYCIGSVSVQGFLSDRDN